MQMDSFFVNCFEIENIFSNLYYLTSTKKREYFRACYVAMEQKHTDSLQGFFHFRFLCKGGKFQQCVLILDFLVKSKRSFTRFTSFNNSFVLIYLEKYLLFKTNNCDIWLQNARIIFLILARKFESVETSPEFDLFLEEIELVYQQCVLGRDFFCEIITFIYTRHSGTQTFAI